MYMCSSNRTHTSQKTDVHINPAHVMFTKLQEPRSAGTYGHFAICPINRRKGYSSLSMHLYSHHGKMIINITYVTQHTNGLTSFTQ